MRFISTSMTRAAIVLAAVSAQMSPASAQQPPQLVIVFDGSGSMWGRLAGSSRSKLSAMRQELGSVLRAKLPNVAVGLTTFGARSGSSCAEAAAALIPFPGQLDRLDQLLGKFNPQGRGPVALGLRTAAQSIRAIPGPVRLLLIHDSPDNCGENVCEFARELAAKETRITVDVVSLGLKPRDRGSMACLTKATGGRLINADTMDAAIAGIGELIAALRKARPVTVRREPAPARRAALADKRAVRLTPNSSGLTLQARLAAGKTEIAHGLTWQIKSLSALKPPIDRSINEPAVDIALPPARYRVTLHTELQSMTKDIEVRKGGRQSVAFEFAGGLIAVAPAGRPSAQTTSTAESGEAMVTVVRTTARGGQAAQAVWSGPARAARALLLERGRYRVTVGNGLNQVSRTFDVTAGSSHNITDGADNAWLTVTAAGLRGDQVGAAEINIAREDPKQPTKRQVIARSASPQATFELPPGPYHITLRTHDTKTTVLVVLGAGETRSQTLELSQMVLRVTSHVGDGDKLTDAKIRYRVWRAGELARPIAISRDAEAVFHLSPGRYRIESRIGRQNAVMIREFDVAAGAFGNLQLRHRAGQVKFAVPPEVPVQRQIAYWEVLDPAGRLVWRSFDSSPSATLAAGTYEATMETGKQRFSKKFSVTAGAAQTVILGSK